MTEGSGIGKVISMSLVVTGYMVGAGILALPINLGPAGVMPALLSSLLVWILMTCNGLVLARQYFFEQDASADLPTLFEAVFGKAGKWISVAANLLILYGLLTAYLAGVASVLDNSLHLPIPDWTSLLMYFCLATLLASLGSAALRRSNAVLMVFMWVLFGLLLMLVLPHSGEADVAAMDWSFLPSSIPILVVAFNFHNIIPTLCRTFDHDQKKITQCILLGSGIGMSMTMFWAVAVMSTLPVVAANGVDIISAFKAGNPATVPLGELIKSRVFVNTAIAFSVVAMTTSYIGTGVSLTGFLRDVLGKRGGRTGLWLLTFVPPLVVGIVYPGIFLQALNIVGGLGIGVLFGILPGILLVRQSSPGSLKRVAGYGVIGVFICVLAVEIAQECGLLQLAPDVEYWSHHVTRMTK